ncbi:MULTISPECIES: TetR/AcrR family transcriptional regulator [Agrobacterium]|uniref:TetR/AcrR family transcriptional regulator n=1 Tax=Agrobacterium TaxID=357 RepID=UPI00041F0E16|nr:MULTISPECIES: TetR/AcrR family transcriptional regulator [Agrobacterium]
MVAYQAFTDGGVEAVKVDALARALDVTRGSFYWHFKDRDALLAKVVDRWLLVETLRIIDMADEAGGTAADRLWLVIESVRSDDGRFELAVRNWACRNAYAAAIVRKADEKRIGHLEGMLLEHGVATAVAARRARFLYLAWLGHYVALTDAGLAEMVDDLRELYRLILT